MQIVLTKPSVTWLNWMILIVTTLVVVSTTLLGHLENDWKEAMTPPVLLTVIVQAGNNVVAWASKFVGGQDEGNRRS